MKIVRKEDVNHVSKPEGLDVWYYLFPEYEVHLNIQPAGTTQAWHRHEKLNETILVIEGELIFKYKQDGEIVETVINQGDLVETGKSFHTFENNSGSSVKFVVIKQVLSGKDNAETFRMDKQLEE